VGTGYTDRMLAELAEALAPLARPASPFADKVPYKEARFVDPELVCDVEFTEWTATNTLRHPSFKGLRDDKAPRDVVKEPFFGGQ
jgi:bifunctional non-homologous end joining protein LigD